MPRNAGHFFVHRDPCSLLIDMTFVPKPGGLMLWREPGQTAKTYTTEGASRKAFKRDPDRHHISRYTTSKFVSFAEHPAIGAGGVFSDKPAAHLSQPAEIRKHLIAGLHRQRDTTSTGSDHLSGFAIHT